MKHIISTGIRADPNIRREILERGPKLPNINKHMVGDSGAFTLLWVCRRIVGEHHGDTRMERILRMESQFDWVWEEDEFTQLVRQMVEPFSNAYYDVFTRLQIIFFPPGVARTVHKDRAVGQLYDNGLNTTGGGYCDAETYIELMKNGTLGAYHYLHRDQHYLGGRLELANDSKITYAKSPDDVYIADDGFVPIGEGNLTYTPGDEFFFAHEERWHSGQPEDTWRGLLFFDGVYNDDAIRPIYDEHLA